MSQTKAELIDAKGDANFDSGTLYVDATNNRVGIGTTSPSKKLEITPGSNQDGISIKNTGAVFGALDFDSNRTSANQVLGDLRFIWNGTAVARIIGESGSDTTNKDDGHLTFYTASAGTPTERARIDSSGRLLVGTSSARSNFFNSTESTKLQVEGTVTSDSSISVVRNSNNTGYPFIAFGKTRGTAVEATTIVQSGDSVGGLEFMGSDGTEFVPAGSIRCEIDGTPGANDMPGRLVFSTTADGASSPTERMRITNGGFIAGRSQQGLVLNGYYVTFDNTWNTVDTWITGGNKAGGGSILAISSNHTGVTSGRSNLTLHYIYYDGNPAGVYNIVNNFNLDIRNNAGSLQIKGFDGGTGLTTQGYVTLIYSDSRLHVN